MTTPRWCRTPGRRVSIACGHIIYWTAIGFSLLYDLHH